MNEEIIKNIDAYFNAANYISACELYLLDNPLLKRPLTKEDIKRKIVGHWGTVPSQNFIYAHLNRLIKEKNLNMIYISGPGHGGNSPVANTYLEGTFSEVYPEITMDEEGLKKLFKSFSFPKGLPSHAAPEVPGSIHEGGELGYSLAHAFGAVLDNPDLIAACVVGDGEAETGPLATSWNGIKFLNKEKDGTVLPILNLNGYKINSPTVLSRMSKKQLANYFYGLGYHPYLVEDENRYRLHAKMYATLNRAYKDIKEIKSGSEETLYPLIILKTKKGWTCPKEYKGEKIEGSFKAHQVPVKIEDDEDIEILEGWLKSYHPEELFDKDGHIKEHVKEIIPTGERRMGANLYANGGALLEPLNLPDINYYSCSFEGHGTDKHSDMFELSKYLKEIYEKNDNFRVFVPDEAMSNRLYDLFKVENRDWQLDIEENDEYLSKDGRIMDSYLSEHFCEGLLEGYLLTGRHGLFITYEAFSRVIDSMASQHAKWLKVASELEWREDISSLNYILTSHVWQQDHNGYTHQEPGFLNHVSDKPNANIYLPYDANSLIVTVNSILKSKNKINVVTASKHPSYQWLNMEDANTHFKNGLSIWNWASTFPKETPDVVIASAGDTPTLESLAAISILKEELPKLKIRYINVIDLMRLKKDHPHGFADELYDDLLTFDKPIIFNFHGYPSLIKSFMFDRTNKNVSVHGYMEEGSITTPFDMRVRNKIDRYHLVIDVINHLDLGKKGKQIIEKMESNLQKHEEYIEKYGVDMPEIADWQWKE